MTMGRSDGQGTLAGAVAGARASQPRPRGPASATLAVVAAALVAAAFCVQAYTDLNLHDEGYLWYGSIAVLKGQVPLRDFQSYDPGRYYWVAAWFWLLGDHGIIPLRIACAAFNFLGVLCGLLVVRRLSGAWTVLVSAGALLTLCVFPPFMMNHTAALAAVYGAVCLIERPTRLRHALAGGLAGLTAFFARNFGGYALLSFSSIIVLSWYAGSRRERRRCALAFAIGMLIGYAPALWMFVAVEQFWEANLLPFSLFLSFGSTNIPKAVPWPWLQSRPWEVCVGLLFVLAPALLALSAGWLALGARESYRTRPVLVAATLVGLPYLHYAFSRPDVEHLAMSIHPLLLALLAAPFEAPRRWRRPAAGLAVAVAALCVVAIGGATPVYRRATAPPGAYVPTTVGGWTVWLPWVQAELIEGAIRFNANVLQPGEGFLIAPFRGPGLYAILNRESPIWQIYFTFPYPESHQRQLIADLDRRQVNWILFEDEPLDGSEAMRFRNTYRLTWEYITTEFEMVPEGLPMHFHLFRRKSRTGDGPPAG